MITAPKEITIRELIDKIQETLPNREITYATKDNLTEISVNIDFLNGNKSYAIITLLDGQFVDGSLNRIVPVEKFKWLYSMWIVGTKVLEE